MSAADNWNWSPVLLNLVDLLTRSGSTLVTRKLPAPAYFHMAHKALCVPPIWSHSICLHQENNHCSALPSSQIYQRAPDSCSELLQSSQISLSSTEDWQNLQSISQLPSPLDQDSQHHCLHHPQCLQPICQILHCNPRKN